jgi:hypothetical protein
MGEDERDCVGCKNSHFAAAWYSRRAAGGHVEYLCGVAYSNYADKAGWVQDFRTRD